MSSRTVPIINVRGTPRERGRQQGEGAQPQIVGMLDAYREILPAATKETWEFLEPLLSLPTLYAPKISWDGKWAAWTWFRVGPLADVYAAPTDGSTPPVRLTETSQDTLLVSWTPDSRAVLVSQDGDGDERAQLFRVDLARPGVMHPLTGPAPNYFLRGGQLHPNGRWLVYAANFDVATGQEVEPTWLYRHNLETGERKPLACPERGCYYEPELNERGTHILYNRNDLHPAGYQVWLVDVEGREDREILNFGPEKKVYGSWFPDGRRVLALAETETHQRVGVWERESGALRWLLDDPDRNVESACVPHGSERAVVVEVKDACVRASLLDVETGEEIRLSEIPGSLVPLAPVGEGKWVGKYYGSRQPADLVRFSPADLRPESFVSLTHVWERTPLSPDDLTAAEDFRWQSVDGIGIQGWLYRTQGEAKGTIVYVHGGPTAHSEDQINPQIQFFVSQGFNVLAPNYRGSTGFRRAFREAIKADGWGGREQEDIRTGIEALIAAGVAEPGKVGITGTSYGGYSSWCAITRFPPEVVVAAAPVQRGDDGRITQPGSGPLSGALADQLCGEHQRPVADCPGLAGPERHAGERQDGQGCPGAGRHRIWFAGF